MKLTKRATRNRENRWKYSFAGLKVANCVISVVVFGYSDSEGAEDVSAICLVVVRFTQLILNLCVGLIEVAAMILRVKTLYLLVSFMYFPPSELSIGLMIPMRLGLSELQPVIDGDRDMSYHQFHLDVKLCLILLSIFSLAVSLMTYRVRDSILKAGGAHMTSHVHTKLHDKAIHEVIKEEFDHAIVEMKRRFDVCAICRTQAALFRLSLHYVTGDEGCERCRKFRILENYY